jgi:hypothetical protein
MRIQSFDPVPGAPGWARSFIYDEEQQKALMSVAGLACGRRPSRRDLDRADVALCATDLEALAQAEAQIRELATLRPVYRPRFDWLRFRRASRRFRPNTDFTQLPSLARLYLFHSDGYQREAACNAISSLNGSAFILCALYARANDWVPQVRNAARDALDRLLPTASRSVLMAALPFLLVRITAWERLDDKTELMSDLMSSPAARAAVFEYLMETQYGPVARVFRIALTETFLDTRLLELGQHATSVEVRCVALETLLFKSAKRRVGYTHLWVDKSFGLKRRIPKFVERAITEDRDAGSLLRSMLSNKSARIRKLAADYLIQRGSDGLEADEIALFMRDSNPGVAERIRFYLRREGESA